MTATLRVKDGLEAVGFHVSLTLSEYTTLTRLGVGLIVASYEFGTTGVISDPDTLRDELRSRIDFLLDAFINDFYKANGR